MSTMIPTDQFQITLDRTANAPCSEGVHVMSIKEGEEAEGPKGPYWKFLLAPQTPGEEGKDIFFIVSLSTQARWRLELFLDAIGAPSTGTATIKNFIGRKFRAQIKHEDYEGRPQARVGEMYPLTVSNPPPMKSPKGVSNADAPMADAGQVSDVSAKIAEPVKPKTGTPVKPVVRKTVKLPEDVVVDTDIPKPFR